ncbi:FAS-associated factor 2 [Drosophila grimshawi]|uniref:GH11459 n=1 Tax=Drosophila grimshawi TaxID=7222 RepID=B4JAN7_DROGR|nr:FAS-associated factor 2 [Drosophila grimshawi]EDW03845.1 GH11459 [Drosophila grimshawi]
MEAEGLTNEQTDKVLQFQDLTGIEDMNICRDILIRHQWDLEVAFQEQMNIREGRPTMLTASSDVRAPTVINDRFLQQIYSANMPGGRIARRVRSNAEPMPRSLTGILGYVINFVFQYFYSTLSGIVRAFINIGGGNEPRLVTDPLADVMKFIREYYERYPEHPVFYQGTYAQALNDAKQELRFLLVYLHKDPSRNPDVESFCRETLSSRSVIDYISANTLLWGCDVSTPEGYRVMQSITVRTYPLMVMISLRANRMIIVGSFEGDCTAEELLRRLQSVISANEVWLSQARADRLERNFTQTLRRQQDEAYEQSLLADEEKERQRQRERDVARQLIAAEEQARRDIELRKEEIARLKIELVNQVPSEPAVNAEDAIAVVFKLPSGTRLERRFQQTNSILDVYHFLFCHPESPDEFEITTNFPKRVLYSKAAVDAAEGSANEIVNKTLKEVGLKNREVLFVNDLEA